MGTARIDSTEFNLMLGMRFTRNLICMMQTLMHSAGVSEKVSHENENRRLRKPISQVFYDLMCEMNVTDFFPHPCTLFTNKIIRLPSL